jgi:polyisoprenoid-binding protein YceI
MRLLAMSVVCGLMLAGCASSPGPAVVAPPADAPVIADAPIDAPSGAYALDPAHARVTWRVMHLGLSGYVGRFETISGALELNAQEPTQSKVQITIDARSLSTGHKDKPGAEPFDTEIARKVLGAEAHPMITFVSTGAQRTGPRTGRLTGDLSFNGVTRPATLDVVFNDARLVLLTGKHTAGFSAATTIQRSEWGADDWTAFVGDAVDIQIEAEFQKM